MARTQSAFVLNWLPTAMSPSIGRRGFRGHANEGWSSVSCNVVRWGGGQYTFSTGICCSSSLIASVSNKVVNRSSTCASVSSSSSSSTFSLGIIAALDINKFRPRSHSFVEVHDMIRPYLQQAGFGHVINITSYGVDRKLLLALCERWRPETHTFHLPTGECTITLEDVHMLMGLRIDGFAVAGYTAVPYSIAEELLGEPLTNTSRKGQFIKMTWLKEKYENRMTLTDASTIEEIVQKARVYLLLLFGGLLFPDTNGNTIHLQYLPLLSDFIKQVVESYFKPGGGRECRDWHQWSAHGMNYEKTPHHCAPGYRTFIDHFEPIDFTWRPYLELEDLEPTDSGVWSSKTFIISFTYIEMHHSDRVKLQFGIKQGIPGPPTCMEEYHKSQLSDQWPYDDWKDHYKNERRQ
ncbi:protein MAIN-LIKE 2-like [Vicia villosa]|uniref:protein MAIN-LIKE 2-like n=1 Tax=Vicia villosa TaxID=3911 RepID=UPI00273A8778|nr:protein MAIN-LIKE 2-like [Vicia villosa]